MGDANVHCSGRQLQAEQLIGGVVGADLAFDDHPGVIAQRQGQIQACEGLADRAAGEGFAITEQYQMIGQTRDFILRMTDVQQRNIQFVMQALQVWEDFAFAPAVESRQRFVHQQQFRAGQQGAGDADALSFAAGQMLWMTLEQMADAEQFCGLVHIDPALRLGDAF